MVDKPRIILVHNVKTPFVAMDEALLQARYAMTSVYIPHRSPRIIAQAWADIRHADLVVAWFASWHSAPYFLMGRLRGIPRLLITGGYDVANMPDIGYGLRRGGMAKWLSGIAFRLADVALPFSDYALHEAMHNTPLPAHKCQRIYLGVPDVPMFAHASAKEPMVFTVSTIDRTSAVRKGIIRFIETAALLPDVPFVLVGKARDDVIDDLRRMATPNVQFTGFLSDADLNALRARAKVYVQVSSHEGFGLAVAEAMLARCTIVATRAGSLPEVIGTHGFFCPDANPQTIADTIQTALTANDQIGEAGRAHILQNFPLDARAQALYALIDGLLKR